MLKVVVAACLLTYLHVVVVSETRLDESDLPVTRFQRHGKQEKNLRSFGLYNKFDWWLGQDGPVRMTERYPSTIFAACGTARRVLHKVVSSQAIRPMIVFGGNDVHASKEIEELEALHAIADIRHENKDEYWPWLGTAPAGLSDHYYRHREHLLFQAIHNASILSKTQTLLAAWSRYYPHLDQLDARQRLDTWLHNHTDIVNRTSVPYIHWFSTLSKHRFLLSPAGSGLQSSKVVEGLLVLTIPIVERSPVYEDLRSEGWPLLVISSWEDITPSLLHETWLRLSPRLETFRNRILLNNSGFFRYLTSIPWRYD